ncbi:MAG: response regulator [Anaerolineae bacterium]
MGPDAGFLAQVAEAYEQLYDLVRLRNLPLLDELIASPGLARKESAWQLHRLLLETIDELDPGPQAPTFSRAWRRHRLMVLRYVQSLEPQAVAAQLAIGKRHYYRLHDAAMAAIADILWERRVARAPTPAPSADGLELLRQEVARASRSECQTDLTEVVEGLHQLLQERLEQQGLALALSLPGGLPRLSVDRNLLRQMLMGTLGHLAEHARNSDIRMAADVEGAAVLLGIRLSSPDAGVVLTPEHMDALREAYEQMAAVSGARILTVHAGRALVGFDLQLPVAERAVLVVDDNDDVLELFRRYLTPNGYPVVTARSASEALDKAARLQPRAITLDLMMPELDGWELMQTLINRAETRHIPIVVCSVLRQQEDLALSLGAAAFLAKPVTEQALLRALQAVDGAEISPAST